MEELEYDYKAFTQHSQTVKFDFSEWLPSMKGQLRPIVPGELVTVLAPTGAGKSTILHNIAMHSAPVPTILFDIELPGTLTFERMMSLMMQTPSHIIESTYEQGKEIDWKGFNRLKHLCVCNNSRLQINDIEAVVNGAEKKMGVRPAMILVDYVGLIVAKSVSRYERLSYVSEELKRLAKSLNIIIVMASQIHRPDPKDGDGEVKLHDAKDSSSIEHSSGVVLGAWREGEKGKVIVIKVLKQTKGMSGHKVHCKFNGELNTITEIPDHKRD